MSPTHAPTPCVEPGCFNLATVKGRCAQCQLLRPGGRTRYDQRRGSARERGYDARWEKRRLRHLRSEPFCRTCGKPGNEVDHVIPHRGVKWLFDLEGNLQTLCESHHAKKTAHERTIPIGMMHPVVLLPEAPHARHTRLVCGPGALVVDTTEEGTVVEVIYGGGDDLGRRNRMLETALRLVTDIPLVFTIAAPRTAERAFWAYVMDCKAELVLPDASDIDAQPSDWWDDFMLDQRAEEAMERRGGG